MEQTSHRRQITISGEQTWIEAWQINIAPTSFDYETQSVYDLQAVLVVPQATIGATTYSAVHKPLDIHLRVSNVLEPPKRTSQAAPADFELRRRGITENLSLVGYWVSQDDPDRNNLAYRLVVSVVGATGDQPTTPASYLNAALVGETFQAQAGAGAVLFSSPRRIKFDIYCREASSGVENSVPLTFYCDAVHERALEDSPLEWAATVPTRLELAVAENVALPHLLRNDIYAESTVSDMSAEAGPISYSLREPRFWIVRNTSFQWNGTLDLAAGETQDFDMADAFRIEGPDAQGQTWTLLQSTDDAAVADGVGEWFDWHGDGSRQPRKLGQHELLFVGLGRPVRGCLYWLCERVASRSIPLRRWINLMAIDNFELDVQSGMPLRRELVLPVGAQIDYEVPAQRTQRGLLVANRALSNSVTAKEITRGFQLDVSNVDEPPLWNADALQPITLQETNSLAALTGTLDLSTQATDPEGEAIFYKLGTVPAGIQASRGTGQNAHILTYTYPAQTANPALQPQLRLAVVAGAAARH